MNICSYGCGQEAIHQLKNGKWCCSKSHTQCSLIRKKNSDRQPKKIESRVKPEFCEYSCGQEAKYQLKNGKWCCNKSCNSCPKLREKNSLSLKITSHYIRFNPNKIIDTCVFCDKSIPYPAKKEHEKYCYLNPNNLKLCIVCEEPIKNYRFNVTCSHICANRHFKQNAKDGEHVDEYRRICFKYHKKECAICGEINILHVHHLDENKENDSPENLIPLCPTHHYYMHCKLKELIFEKVNDYLTEWKNSQTTSSTS